MGRQSSLKEFYHTSQKKKRGLFHRRKIEFGLVAHRSVSDRICLLSRRTTFLCSHPSVHSNADACGDGATLIR